MKNSNRVVKEPYMLPDFICVGPGRAGTSWLYEVLGDHPGICMARNIKETQYFNANFGNGVQWYKRFFQDCGESTIKGEISNRYIFDGNVACRIKELIPQCKIIVCLRNPYERIQSVYSFKIREGALKCSFEEALVKMPELIEENRYFSLLKPYYDLFDTKNIYLLRFEDIAARSRELCSDIYRFLGVRDDIVPSGIDRKINQAVIPRFPMVSQTTKAVAKLLRRFGLYRTLTAAKKSDILKSLLFKPHRYADESLLTPAAISLIEPVVRPEIVKLEALIGQSLEHWVPANRT